MSERLSDLTLSMMWTRKKYGAWAIYKFKIFFNKIYSNVDVRWRNGKPYFCDTCGQKFTPKNCDAGGCKLEREEEAIERMNFNKNEAMK